MVSLQPGQSVPFQIRCRPTTVGAHVATFAVTSNDTDEIDGFPTRDVTCWGVSPEVIPIDPPTPPIEEMHAPQRPRSR